MNSSSKSTLLKKLLPALVVVGVLIAAFRTLPVGEWLQSALDWVEGLGPWGPVAFIALYALAVVFFFPASVMTLAAGTGFGVVLGRSMSRSLPLWGRHLPFW